jgi:hypothetical protein
MEAGFQVLKFRPRYQENLQALNSPAGSLKENYVKYYLTPTSLFMEAKKLSLEPEKFPDRS